MGLPPERKVSDEALSEIQFIADVSGMTALMKKMRERKDGDPKARDEIERIETTKSRDGKFAGFPGEKSDA
jgi:hypothetical protein